MASSHPRRSGAQVLIDQLRIHGTDTIFGVPGESYLAALDALYAQRNSMRFIICRQEGGAANMAEAYGKLTGKPGICFVTRGPGATNASIAVHTAFQDSTPMILFIGQVGTDFVEREAFQEIDYRRMYGQMAKWVASIDRADRVPEYLSHAFHCAMSGRKGPVVLALPEDVLVETAAVADTDHYREVQASPAASDVERLRALLAAAERPLVVAGEGGWTAEVSRDVLAFCETNALPVACAFRCQDFVDNRSPSYVGVLGVAMDEAIALRLRDADLVLAVGGRLGEVPTRRYTLLEPPNPRQTLIRIHPDRSELARVYEADLVIAATLPEAASALRGLEPLEPRWREWTAAARADYEDNLRHEPMEGPVDLGAIMAFLRGRLPADTVQTCGAGNFTVWAHRFAEFTQFGTQACPRSGSMGYGLPAAVAAQLVHPERVVVCFTGDGDFVMSSPELATAVQYDLPIVVLLVNNGMYATIRMHQERQFPGRVVGTDLENPDFVALAHAYGAHGERVERTDGFEPAFERALGSGKPAVLELPVDPERISPRVKLSELQKEAV
jgi:acetolactate synthase-1/2/3 large subunit